MSGFSPTGQGSPTHINGMGNHTETTLADRINFTSRGLVVIDPDLLAKVNRPALSHSTSTAFISKCAARWVAEREHGEVHDPYGPAQLGKAGHDVLEQLHLLPPSKRDESAAFEIAMLAAVDVFPDPSHGENPATLGPIRVERTKWVYEVMLRIKGLWDIEDPRGVETLHTEFKFENIEVAGVPYIGYADRIDRIVGKGGKPITRTIDIKTNAKMPVIRFNGDEHGDQLRLYRAAEEAINGSPTDELWLHYTKLGKAKKVAQSAQAMKATLDQFATAWDKMQTSMSAATFPTKPSALCGYCVLVNVCPTAAKEGAVDRTGGTMPTATMLGFPGPVTLTIPSIETSDPALTGTTPDPQMPEENPAGGPETGTTTGVAALSMGVGQEPTSPTKETPMYETHTKAMAWCEDKPFEDRGSEPNAAGYAAGAVFTYLNWATRLLRNLNYPITPEYVESLAWTLRTVCTSAQYAMTGRTSLADGANKQMRSVLGQLMIGMPVPLKPAVNGEIPPLPSEAEWSDWVSSARARCIGYAQLAYNQLTADENPQRPYAALCGSAAVTALRPDADGPTMPPEAAHAPVEAPDADENPFDGYDDNLEGVL